MMVDRGEVAFANDDIFVLIRAVGRNALGPEGLVLDLQQILYSGVFEHGCRTPEIEVFVGIFDLHVDNGSVVF